MVDKILTVVMAMAMLILIIIMAVLAVIHTVSVISGYSPHDETQRKDVGIEVPHTSYWEAKTTTITIDDHQFTLIANSRQLSVLHSPSCPVYRAVDHQ